MRPPRVSGRSAAWGLVVTLGLGCGAPIAGAETVLLSQTTLVDGTETTVDSFVVPSDGTITIQLTNLPWPVALSSLSFMATTANKVVSSWTDDGSRTVSFQVDAGTYFAHITGEADSKFDVGVYSLMCMFQPTPSAVPLPNSGWLLGLGLLGLALPPVVHKWRRRQGGPASTGAGDWRLLPA
jgi:hypothetical protein